MTWLLMLLMALPLQDDREKGLQDLRAQLDEVSSRLAKMKEDGETDTEEFRKLTAERDALQQQIRRMEGADKERRHDEGRRDEEEIARATARIEKDPKDVEAYMMRAKAYMRLKKFDSSIADYDKTIAIKPDFAEAYLQRGQARMGKGDKEGAYADWDQAVRLKPDLRDVVEGFKRGRRPDGPRERDGEIERIRKSLKDPNLKKEDREKLERRLEELERHRPDRDFPDRKRMLEEVKAYLKDFEPELLQRLDEALRAGHEQEADHILREAWGRMRDLQEMKERNPQEYERMLKMRRLESEAFALGDKLRRTPQDDKDNRARLRKQLEETLSALFDMREETRSRELADLKRRLEELERTLEKRKTNKKSIIEKRIRELSGEKSTDDDW